MAAMDEARCSLTDHIPHEVEMLGKWPSNLPFPLRLCQVKNTFRDIRKYMVKDDQISIFLPPTDSTIDEELLHNLHARIQVWGDQTRYGLVHVTKSLTVLMNLEPINIPKGIQWEIFIVFPDRPCVVLCVSDNTHNPSHKKYLLRLTRNVICKLRKFTSEHVSAIYGLLGRAEIMSYDAFSKQMEDFEEETSQFCNPESLMMDTEKCDDIIKAFLASVAATDLVAKMKDKGNDCDKDCVTKASVDTVYKRAICDKAIGDKDCGDNECGDNDCGDKDTDKETLWFLTLEQFQIFVNNIDRDFVVLESVQKSGATLLLVEVGRRLNKIGSTVLTFWQKICHILRRRNIASLIMTPSELKSQIPSTEVNYLVAEGVSVKDVENMQNGNFLKIWLVNPDNTSEAEVHNADVPEDMDETSNDEEGYESAVSDCAGNFHSSNENSD